ncbi:TraR/DksA C4-type zinc finger protein [Neobacillus terrae]|uniref:TraR/DksA C4-type zinc finger protein n=1 Tax=Neobacillus terrae TaxID=3034837 RepID=UPI00140D1D46|nr:TraR/DksA C4-type zinc finger protein [Neobacillus terrae]NHM32577.1 yteA family sporulation protein [Neobacillus terrae]
MLSSQQMAELQTRLSKEKSELQDLLKEDDQMGFNRGFDHESMGELSSYDNHPADDGTELYEREKDIALREHYNLELRNINAALDAIAKGDYGKCHVCGKDIPLERLEALPTTLYCKEHSPDQVVSHERPLEEGVLMEPFGKFDLDEIDESVAFDAEDSWQDVAVYGTSETPSDLAFSEDAYNDMYVEADENLGYVEDFENFAGNDMYGKNVTVYPNAQHELYEAELDEEGIMTTFGDLPGYEHDPYVEND